MNANLKNILIFSIYLVLRNTGLNCLFGQAVSLPNITPPSPQAQEFMKYIDYPVNYSTGLPIVNIPLYIIQSKELSLPISLSYHASGLKPNDNNGYFGQGWTLNAGGQISRIINKVPDEKNLTNLIRNETEFPYYCDQFVSTESGDGCVTLHSDDEATYLWHISGEILRDPFDAEYDIFYYTLPEQNGKFIYERNAQNLFKPVILPFKPLIINTYGTTSINGEKDITHFEITDENGVLYRFGKSVVSDNDITERRNSYNLYGELSGGGKTSWMITEIISSDKTDTISFEYTISSYIKEFHIPFSKGLTHTHYFSTGQNPPDWSTNVNAGGGLSTLVKSEYTQSRITRIKFKNGEVRFSYLTDTKLRLDRVEIFDKNSTIPLKTIKLVMSQYVTGSPHWYRLDTVKYLDKNSSNIQHFSFQYYLGTYPSMISNTMENVVTYETYSIDYWGFYNGANNVMLLAEAMSNDPYSIHPNLGLLYGTANRNPNPDFAKIGVLKQINYPTGGSTTYEYEGNKTSYGVMLGGLRVNKITHVTGNEALTRTFYYTASNSSIGEPVSLLSYNGCFKSFSVSYSTSGQYVAASYTNSSSPQIDYNLNAQPITYCKVDEYHGDSQNNLGRIEHTFDLTSAMSNSDIVVDEFPTYDMHLQGPWYGTLTFLDLNFGKYIYYQQKYRYGEIFENETMIYDAGGTLRKHIVKKYNNQVIDTYNGLYAKRTYNGTEFLKNNHFWKRTYTIEQLLQRLVTDTTYEYSDNSGHSIITANNYNYNSDNLLTEKITDKSDGQWIKTLYTYPKDETCTYCTSMTTNNILTPVINKKEYTKTTTSEQLLNTLHTDYNNYGKPVLIKTATGNNTPEDRLQYTYDSNTKNLIQVQKTSDVPVSYLWAYNNTLPVVKAINFDNSTLSSKIIQSLSGTGYSTLEALLNSITSLPNVGWNTFNQNLRNNTSDALITTYTYNPLVGITSETNERGITTYYEYDSFGRLKTIKDNIGNVLKQYEYHYKE
jgi:YD repeat-containing protein